MPSSRGIRAGRAFVELFADDSKLVRGLRRAEKKLKAFGAGIRNLGLKMAGLGAAALTPMLGAVKAFASMGDHIGKMAKRTGFSVEALSELAYVASQSGTDIDSLEKSLARMQRSIYDAGRGLSTATDALTDLGLSYKDLDGLAPDKQFALIADKISKISDPTKKAALAMTLLGRSGTQLLPMMANGAKGIEDLRVKARALGQTMSAADVKAAEDFTDTLDNLWKSVKMGVFHVGASLAPALQRMSETLTDIAVKASAWIKANRDVVVSVAKVAAMVVAGGIALAALGTAVSLAGTVLGGLATVLGVVMSPLGLVIGAVVALGTVLASTTNLGGKAVGWLGKAFSWFKGAVITAISAIVFAVKNWQAVLEYAATAAVLHIVRFASQVKYFFVEVIPATLKWFWNNWRDIFTTMWNFTKTIATNIGKNLKALWDAIIGFATGKGWNFKWTPLLEGFESTIKEMPKIAARQMGPLERELQGRVDALGANLSKKWKAHDAEFKANLGDSPFGKLLGLNGQGPKVEIKTPDTKEVKAAANRGGAELGRQAAKIGVTGTFNAASLLGLQASGAADRTAKATEETAKQVKKLNSKAAAGGMTFSK